MTVSKIDRFYPGKSAGQFEMSLTTNLPVLLNEYAPGQEPVLIFCSTQRSAIHSASFLAKSMSSCERVLETFSTTSLPDLLRKKVAFIHGKIPFAERCSIQNLFIEGKIKILCLLNSFANYFKGSASLVIIKGDCKYVGDSKFEKYSTQEIIKMSSFATKMTVFMRPGDSNEMEQINRKECLESLNFDPSSHAGILECICTQISGTTSWGESDCINWETINTADMVRFPLDQLDHSKGWQSSFLLCQLILGGGGGDVSIFNRFVSAKMGKIMKSIANQLDILMVKLGSKRKNSGSLLRNALELKGAINGGLWHDSDQILRQIEGIGYQYCSILKKNGISDFNGLRDCTASKIQFLLKRNPPFGYEIRERLKKVPILKLSVQEVADTIVIEYTITCEIDTISTVLLVDIDGHILTNEKCSSFNCSTNLTLPLPKRRKQIVASLINCDYAGINIHCIISKDVDKVRVVKPDPKKNRASKTIPSIQTESPKLSSEVVEKHCDIQDKVCKHKCRERMACKHQCCKVARDRPVEMENKKIVSWISLFRADQSSSEEEDDLIAKRQRTEIKGAKSNDKKFSNNECRILLIDYLKDCVNT